MLITKRDGRKVKFDETKIINAIRKAFEQTENEKWDEYAFSKATNIASFIKNKVENSDKEYDVEQIQDLVENGLMSCKKKNVAREYIKYRAKRNELRNKRSEFNKLIGEKLTASNVQNSNANMDEYSFGGRMGEAGSELAKKYALENVISKKFADLHNNNICYIHDLNSVAIGSHNCLTIPIDDLLKNGFDTRQQTIREATTVSSALQLIAVIMQCQSLVQFGGVSASHLDWTLVPYVRKSFSKHMKDGLRYVEKITDENYINSIPKELSFDNEYAKTHKESYEYAMDMTKREVYQAVEGLLHNLNSLQSRSGNQLPFSSVNYGTCTLEEGRLVTRAILENTIKGGGKLHSTYIFPCQIFKMKRGVNRKKGDPNYDLYNLALKCTARRLYPNYANVDWSTNQFGNDGSIDAEMSTMGCRTYNGYDMNGFGQMKDGRGNIAPNTIILPTLAMMAKGEIGNKDIEDFMNILDKTIFDARDQLIERYNWICSQDPKSATFMYGNNTMRGYAPEEGIRSALKHGTLAIGQIGLAETLQILIGEDQTSDKGMELAKKIEKLFNTRCDEFKHELHRDSDGYEYYLNFGVYLTPAENLSYTSMKKFQKKYGKIPNISENEFFTNSIHVPTWKEINPFEKIDIESELAKYSNAGCITYVELESSVKNNLDALETIVNYAMDKDIPYFAINVPNDTCMNCGFTDDLNDSCPECGSTNIQRLRRVTGYISTDYHNFNLGKQQEVEMRYKHSKKLTNWNR